MIQKQQHMTHIHTHTHLKKINFTKLQTLAEIKFTKTNNHPTIPAFSK